MNNHLRFVPLSTILARFHRDLKGSDLNESDAIEWIGEALGLLQVHGLTEEVVEFAEVSGHDILFPDNMHQILQIARNVNWCPGDETVTCPTEIYDSSPLLACDGAKSFSIDSLNGKGAFPTDYQSWDACGAFNSNYVPVRLSTNSFFRSVVCLQNEQSPIYASCVDEYSLISSVTKRIRFSFEKGFVAIAYSRHRIDSRTGYPLVPDNISFQSAIMNYIKWKLAEHRLWNGVEGSAGLADRAERLWLKYARQAKNYMKMPKTIDEYQNFKDQTDKMIPVRNQYDGFFGNLNHEEHRGYTDPDRRKGHKPELVSGCLDCEEETVVVPPVINFVQFDPAQDVTNEEDQSQNATYQISVDEGVSIAGITFDVVLAGNGGNPITPGVDATLQYLDGLVWTDVLLGQVTIPTGETSLTIRVIAINDADVEGTEGFSITLSNPSVDVVFTNATVTGTIIETDVNGVTFVAASIVSEEENPSVVATYELIGVGGTIALGTTVDVTLLAGSGLNPIVPGVDAKLQYYDTGTLLWVDVLTTVTLPPSQGSVQVRVYVIDDVIVEGTETFEILVENPTGGVVIDGGSVTVTGSITETDTNHITLVDTDPPSTITDEANLLTATYELNRGATTDPNISVTVNVALTGVGVSPVDPSDVLFEEFDGAVWTTVGATLTLAVGETSKQLRVTGVDDVLIEDTEAFDITISAPTNSFIIDNAVVSGTITSDDALAFLSLHFVGEYDGAAQEVAFTSKITSLYVDNIHSMTTAYTIKFYDGATPPVDWSVIATGLLPAIQTSIDGSVTGDYFLYFEVQTYNNTFLNSVLTLSYVSQSPVTTFDYVSMNTLSQDIMIGLPSGHTYQLDSITSGNGVNASLFHFAVIYDAQTEDLTSLPITSTPDLTALNNALAINQDTKVVKMYIEYQGTNTSDTVTLNWIIT